MSLKEKAIHGVKWTSLSSITIAILQLVQISILARYLSPKDFGLMAIVMVVINFSRIFSDMGISNSIIHHQKNSKEQLSSLYWLNIFLGTILSLILMLVSPLISEFYNEPELTTLLGVVSISFVISSFGNQYRILFQKELQFNFIAKIEIIASSVAFIVGVLSAINNLGVYSLVYASLTQTTVASLLFLLFGIHIHRPLFIFKYSIIKEYLGFGMYQTGQSTLNYFNSQFDVILIGKLLGPEILGIYSVVKQLAMKPAQIINPIITKVAFPILAKVQNDKNRLKDVYLKTINNITSINFLIYILMFILAEPIILIFFGEKWRESIPIFQILSIYFMIRSIGNPIGSLVMATGKVHLEFWWNVGMFIIFPITIYIGSKFGIIGISISLLILMIITIVPMWFFMVKSLIPVTLKEYLLIIMKPLVLILISSLSVIPIALLKLNMIISTTLVISLMIATYIYLNYLFNINIMTFFTSKGKK